MPTYENPVKTYHDVKTVFDLTKMQSIENNYDDRLIHPMHHKIEFIGRNGVEKVNLSVGQLAIITAIIEKFQSPGKAIDYLFEGLATKENDVKSICSNF